MGPKVLFAKYDVFSVLENSKRQLPRLSPIRKLTRPPQPFDFVAPHLNN